MKPLTEKIEKLHRTGVRYANGSSALFETSFWIRVKDVALAVEELKDEINGNRTTPHTTSISIRKVKEMIDKIFGEFSNSNHSPKSEIGSFGMKNKEAFNLSSSNSPEDTPEEDMVTTETPSLNEVTSSGISNSQEEICENCGHTHYCSWNCKLHHYECPDCKCKKFKQKKEKK